MIPFKKIIAICFVAFVVAQLTAGCDLNNSENIVEDSSKVLSEEDTIVTETQKDSIIHPVSCLDMPFIEGLKTGWTSGYKDPRLAKNGFVNQTTRTIEYGKEKIFKNYSLKKELSISKVEYPDGETCFTVKYPVTLKQMQCFEKNLPNSYTKKDGGKYSKKGLGTYAEKHITCDSKALLITYTHTVGKELSLPPPSIENMH